MRILCVRHLGPPTRRQPLGDVVLVMQWNSTGSHATSHGFFLAVSCLWMWVQLVSLVGDVPYRHMATTCVFDRFWRMSPMRLSRLGIPSFWLGSPARVFFHLFTVFGHIWTFCESSVIWWTSSKTHRFRCQCQASVRCAELFDVHKTKPNPKERPKELVFYIFRSILRCV